MAEQRDPLMDVLQRATTDPEYREALKADPAKVFAEAGVEVPEGVSYEVIENTPDKFHIVLPPLAEEELGGEALEGRVTKSALLCAPGEGGQVTAMPVCIVG